VKKKWPAIRTQTVENLLNIIVLVYIWGGVLVCFPMFLFTFFPPQVKSQMPESWGNVLLEVNSGKIDDALKLLNEERLQKLEAAWIGEFGENGLTVGELGKELADMSTEEVREKIQEKIEEKGESEEKSHVEKAEIQEKMNGKAEKGEEAGESEKTEGEKTEGNEGVGGKGDERAIEDGKEGENEEENDSNKGKGEEQKVQQVQQENTEKNTEKNTDTNYENKRKLNSAEDAKSDGNAETVDTKNVDTKNVTKTVNTPGGNPKETVEGNGNAQETAGNKSNTHEITHDNVGTGHERADPADDDEPTSGHGNDAEGKSSAAATTTGDTADDRNSESESQTETRLSGLFLLATPITSLDNLSLYDIPSPALTLSWISCGALFLIWTLMCLPESLAALKWVSL
jgi:hypothetical protein